VPVNNAALNVALVQKAASLEPAENRAALDVVGTIVARAEEPLDLVVFPEVFMRDFGKPGSDIAAFAEELDGPFVSRLTELAKEHAVTLVAGLFERSSDPARPYNTVVVVDRDGLRASYRKIHLYDSFGYKESDRLLAGDIEPLVVDLAGMSVGFMTCYDLRFPELAREITLRGAELLVVPAAWVDGPAKVDHWRTLVRARAIENTVYVAACAQPGPRYSGHTMLVDPRGEVLAEAETEGDTVVTGTVERDVIGSAREENPSLQNRRF
jgi:predicted amidohydrolase